MSLQNKKPVDTTRIFMLFAYTLLIILNGCILFFCYTAFITSTTYQSSTSAVVASQLLPTFNTSLYTQIQKDRATRQMYTDTSQLNQFSVNEIF